MLVNLIKSGGGTKSDSTHYDWNGASGITSSSAAGNKLYTALGIRDYGYNLINRPAPATLQGVEIESSTSGGPASVAVMYTYFGDMDLDGKVTVQDYNEFLYYYNPANRPPDADITWMTGDFNYDGKIDVKDYNLLLAGYYHQGAVPTWVWAGSTTAWATGSNWQTAGSEPGSSNRAVFNAAAANQPTIVGSASVLGVDFQTGGWQINGSGSTLTIGAGGLTSTSNTGGTNTINSNVTLGGTQTWTTSSGNTVVVNGAMTFGASTLTKNGPGTLTLGTTGLSTTYSAGSALNVSGGTLNLLSAGGDNANRNLAVTVNNATLAVGRTQYLASLTLTSGRGRRSTPWARATRAARSRRTPSRLARRACWIFRITT